MNDSEARTKLLEEHAQLRRLAEAAKEAAGAVVRGRGNLSAFRRTLFELRTAFVRHNFSEEQLLERMLVDADAGGSHRLRRMIEEHSGEHAAMRAALAGEELEVAPRVADLVEELLAHMDAEERTFLHPAVLPPHAAK